jgi:hypothetical protein
MKRALPSALRRLAVIGECHPMPTGAAFVVAGVAAVGLAIDAHSQRKEWTSFGKHKMDVYAYGEEVHDVLTMDTEQTELVREGWELIAAWVDMLPKAVSEEALEEAVHPTGAESPAATTSCGDE